MRQLKFDQMMRIPKFVQDGRGHPPKAVTGHASGIPHPLECRQNGVVAHWLFMVTLTWENQLTSIRQRLQRLDYFNGLR